MSERAQVRKLSFKLACVAAGAVLVIAAIVFAASFASAQQTAYAADNADGSVLTNAEMNAQSEGSITRAQWVAKLVDTFNMTIETPEGEDPEYPDDYFEDVSDEHEFFLDIMKATDFGVIDTPAGELFNPDEPATREFAAHTLNYCLGYQLDEGVAPQYTKEETDFPEDLQVALDRGWFGTTKVNVKVALSEDECDAMLDDARDVLAETAELLEQANNVQLAANVKVVPAGTEYTVNAAQDDDGDGIPDGVADTITVSITNCPITITVGDLFAVYSGDLPVAYKAIAVNTIGNLTVIEAVDADSEAYTTLVYSNEQEFDLAEFEEANGVATQMYDSLEAASEAGVDTGGFTTQSLAAQGISYDKGTLSFSASYPPTTITGSITGMKTKCTADLSKNKYYASLSGTTTLTGTIAGETGELSIPLGSAPAGPFEMGLYAKAYAEGSITVTTSATFEVGAEYSGGSFRMIKSFKKGNPGLAARATAAIYLEAAASGKVPGLSAYMRAKLGYEADYCYDQWPYDGKRPYVCQDFDAYLFSGLSAGITAGVKPVAKSAKWSYDIWTPDNSPVRLHTHNEDGSNVPQCTRGKVYKHKGRWGIRWGGFASSDGSGEGGAVEYAWYEHEPDGSGNTVITKYHGNMRALIVPDTLDGNKVIGIGEDSFKENGYLNSVILPEGVTYIGISAFRDCKALSLATIPSTCKDINEGAFADCVSLTTVNIPKDVNKEEGHFAPFENCDSLLNVSFANGTTIIVDSLFERSGLKTIAIPDTVTHIGRSSFEECEQLQSIRWGKAVIEIGDAAFAHCTALTEVNLPDSVKLIGIGSFHDCTALSTVRFPKDVEVNDLVVYGATAPFDQCGALKDVQFAEGTTALANGLLAGSGIEGITIPDTVVSIGQITFYGCEQLRAVNWGKSLRSIGGSAFADCAALTKAILPDTLTFLDCAVFANCDALAEVYIPKKLDVSDLVNYGATAPFSGCDGNAKAIIAEGREYISNGLFKEFHGLIETNIPSSVKTIGAMAFSDSGLKTVAIPTSVTEIQYDALAGTALTEVAVPDSVTVLGDSVFMDCTNLAKVTLPATITEMPSNLLRNTAITEVTIPDTVEYIGSRALSNCEKLTTVKWSTGLTEMGDGVFRECPALKSVSIPATVRKIGDELFYDCDALVEATIPNSVIELGQAQFYDCDALTTVSLGMGITQIPEDMFRHCDALMTVVLPNRVETIGPNSFMACVKFANITIPRATTSIDESAFSYPTNMTVYGETGTTAETWAKENGAKFVAINKPVTSVSLSPTELTMHPGEEAFLVASVEPVDFTGTTEWKSSDPDVVWIDGETGRIVSENGGVATIEFSAGGKVATCTVTVVKPVEDVYVDPGEREVTCGETVQLSANVWPSDATDKSVVWSSSDTTLATVDQAGKVTTLAAGKVTIKATSKDNSEAYGTCELTINAKPDRVVISVPTATPNLVYDGSVKTGVAAGEGYTVSGGTATDAGEYTATVTADSNHVFASGKSTATVAWSIAKAKPTLTIKAGKNASVAMGKSINLGVSASGGGKLTFSSSNTKVATVSSTGVAKSVNVGTAVISVKAAETTNYSAINESVNLKVTQGTQSLSFANQSKKVTYSKVKKAKQTVAIIKAKNAKTKVSYSITKSVKGKKKVKYFTIASSTGKITVKKGTPKGTYKVTVKAAAKQTANWKAANKSAVITIKVK